MCNSLNGNFLIQPIWLDWAQRPETTVQDIEGSFQKVALSQASEWGSYNGDTLYGICGVDELILLKKLILERYPNQKEFHLLDVGAGNFQWSLAVADFIEKQTDLPKDIKVHIIGIRGEKHLGQRIMETDRCKVYHLGAFKVEEVFKQFKEQGFDLESRLDIVVSRWCIRHVNDGVGLLQQLFNLTRPKYGYLLFDGFFFLRNQETMEESDANGRLTRLLQDMKVPFLVQHHRDTRSLNQFIVKRPDDTPCQIPMNYVESCHVDGKAWQIGCGKVMRFKRNPQPSDKETVYAYSDDAILSGDRAMYEWLKKSEALDLARKWRPLLAKEAVVHQAALQNDIAHMEELLKQHDIDEQDSKGCTPLHVAIQKGSFEGCQSLITRGASLDLFNDWGRAALHEAAAWDKEGRFLQAVINAGAKIEAKTAAGKTPLEAAIEAKNPKGVEILVKHGATILQKHHKVMNGDSAFTQLYRNGIISNKPKGEGYAEVYDWIKQGNCIVLHYNGSKGIMYYPNQTNADAKLIYVDIHPQTGLLAEGEWPSFLKAAGFDAMSYDKEKIAHWNLTQIENYQFGYD